MGSTHFNVYRGYTEETIENLLSLENFPPGDSTVSIHHGVGQSTLCNYSRPFTFKPRVEQLAELLSTVTEPLSLIASAYKLNENDIVAIDFKMSSIFQMNCPKDFHLLKENSMDPSCRIAGNCLCLFRNHLE